MTLYTNSGDRESKDSWGEGFSYSILKCKSVQEHVFVHCVMFHVFYNFHTTAAKRLNGVFKLSRQVCLMNVTHCITFR